MLLTFILAGLLAATSFGQDMTGEDVIRAMHERYDGKWYETLALVQTVNYFDRESGAFDSARVWYESIQLPGMVRSDVAPLDAGNRWLYRDQTWIEIRADTVYSNNPGPHPLLLLGFDVYLVPVEETVARLQRFGIDFAKVHEGVWQGREAYVVGSSAPDDESNQFWIDKERLVFLRLVLTNPRTQTRTEYRFDRYERLGGGWIGTDVVFMRNGIVTMLERYDWWDIGLEFSPSLFAVDSPSKPTWVRN